MKDPIQKRIDQRIKVKDAREDAKQRSITVSWALNCATELCAAGKIDESEIENMGRVFLGRFGRLFEERSQEAARKEEEADNAMDSAENDASN